VSGDEACAEVGSGNQDGFEENCRSRVKGTGEVGGEHGKY